MARHLVWRTLAVLAVLGAAVAVVINRPVQLGLDLRGGTQIVLETQDTEFETVDDDTVVRTLEVLRRRVDQLGVTEPSLQRSGDRRVIIELPGVTDPDEALDVIGQTAQLTFHAVEDIAGPEDRERRRNRQDDEEDQDDGDTLVLPAEDGERLELAPAALTGDAVGDAEAVIDTQIGEQWTVSISFRGDGGAVWADLTGQAACAPPGAPQRRVAIVLDEEVISSPEVANEVQCEVGIRGGDTIITGSFSAEEAKDLALLIRAGALPVPVEVVERRTVGPTLGAAAIRASVEAAIIGGALTILYVIAYYRILGLLAALALLIYGLLSYSVLLALGATLTLPGIAGFVLAIGMAVDANVLVFERSKEEFAEGKRIRAAALAGFKKAWSAIADSNATTLIAAIILFFFATGAVRGFGITVTIGVAVSLFTALVVTRLLVEVALRSATLSRHAGAMGMNVGGKLRRRFEERPFDIMSRAKWWFSLSGIALLIALVGLYSQGLNFGLEFTGGQLIEYETAQSPDLDDVRAELATEGFPRAVVQESGDGNVAIRVATLAGEDEERIEAAVQSVAGSTTKVRDEFIGPTIGEELRRKALIALTLGLSAQLLYLAFRFRWTYGASAVAALFHDVMLLLGIFAWLQKDIDGVFIAGLLTVIGYSVNDSVVVFDRIREQRHLRQKEELSVVANDAALQTIPRTINTGLGALFILVALYFLGGETLTDFALTLIIGVLVGTYSSIFTASPLAVVFERFSKTDQTSATPARGAPRRPAVKPRPARAPVTPPSPDDVVDDEDVAAPTPPPRRAAAGGTTPPRPRAGSAKRKRRKR